MFYRLTRLPSLILLFVVGLVSACGGGGQERADTADNDSPAVAWSSNPGGASTFNGAPAAYQGAISGLGSIVVNGVRFETTDALVYESDDFNTSYGTNASTFTSPLALGMTVSLFGDVDDAQNLGRAARIRVVGGVRGVMSSVDTHAMTLTLPTQTIQLSAATTYGGTSDGTSAGTAISSLVQLAALPGNPLLTVYGQTQADGSFLATRIVVTHSQAHALDVAVRGKVIAVSGSNYTLKTDAVHTINVTCAAPCVVQPTGNVPVVGDEVRALAVDLTQWSNSTLNASRIQLVNAQYLTTFTGAPRAPSYAKIKGTASFDGSRWWVGGVEVTGAPFTAGTAYEVKGTWSGAVLIASRVEVEGQRTFEDNEGSNRLYSNEFYGVVSNLNGSAFTVQGVNVNAAAAYFPLGSSMSLSNGTFVEVKGSYANGVLNASKVEIKSVSSSNINSNVNASTGRVFEMYGLISGWAGHNTAFTLTRFGVAYSAQTSNNTRFDHGVPSTGSYVEAKGYMDANNVFQIIKLEVKNGFQDYED